MSRVLIIDDTDPNIVYNGGWINAASIGPFTNEYMNTTKKSVTPGDSISYRWIGKQISVFGTLDQPAVRGSPNASFSIDGNVGTLFNDTGAVIPANSNLTSHVVLYQSPLMDQGVHTISVTIAPSSFVGAGAAPSFYFDFFTTVTDCVPPFSNVMVDDTDPSVEYRGTWDDVVGATYYMQTSRRVASGSATFRFYGTEVALFGTKARVLLRTVTIEGLGNSTRVRPTARQYPHTRMFFNNSLSGTEEHSLVMRNSYKVNVTDTNSTSFDYLVYNTGNSAAAGVSDHCISNEPANKIAIITGGVVGGVALILIIMGAVFFKRRRAKLVEKDSHPAVGPEVQPALTPAHASPLTTAGVVSAQHDPHSIILPASATWGGSDYSPTRPSSYAPSNVPQHSAPPGHGVPPSILPFSPQSEVDSLDSGKARFGYTPAEGGAGNPWPQLEQVPQDPMTAPPPSYGDHH